MMRTRQARTYLCLKILKIVEEECFMIIVIYEYNDRDVDLVNHDNK